MEGIMFRKNKYIIIIGCGRLGSYIAEYLSDKGEDVLIIDKDEDAFRKLSPSYAGQYLLADGMDMELYNEINITKANAVVVVTDSDNSNIFIAQLVKKTFKNIDVMARLHDPDKSYVYKDMDIKTLCPAMILLKETEKIMGWLN